jgi:hypothetical protein
VNKVKSGFLFATPTFTSGFARVLDLYGVYDKYNSSNSDREADCRAIWADWRVVGQDVFSALREFENSLPANVDQRNELCGIGEQMSFFS